MQNILLALQKLTQPKLEPPKKKVIGLTLKSFQPHTITLLSTDAEGNPLDCGGLLSFSFIPGNDPKVMLHSNVDPATNLPLDDEGRIEFELD